MKTPSVYDFDALYDLLQPKQQPAATTTEVVPPQYPRTDDKTLRIYSACNTELSRIRLGPGVWYYDPDLKVRNVYDVTIPLVGGEMPVLYAIVDDNEVIVDDGLLDLPSRLGYYQYDDTCVVFSASFFRVDKKRWT